MKTPILSGGAPRPAADWRQPAGRLGTWLAGSLLLLSATAGAAPIVKTVGASGNYPTIAAALNSISTPLTQAVEIQLLDASYTENVTITKAGTAANGITIRPAAGVTAVLNGTLTFGAGSAYVTVSGHNGSNARRLTLRQTDDVLSTVQFVNDAHHNSVQQTRVLGSCRLPGAGVVTIGNAAAGGAGNDNNTLSDNYIGNAVAAPLPATLVYAFNIRTGILNDAVTIADNDLANFTDNGIQVVGGNGVNWSVSNNDFFYDAAAMPGTVQTAVDFRPGAASSGNTISGNTIGGRGPQATGGTWVNSGAEFRGVVADFGAGTASTLANNVISNVSVTNTSQPLTAMSLEDGRAVVSGITVINVSNSGQGGVVSLNSGADTDLSNFAVASGQIVNVETGGQLNVAGNLRNDGVLKNAGDILVTGDFLNSGAGTYNQTQGNLEIRGDMNNQGGTFTSVGGLVKLTGNRTQLVSGGVYFNLEINGSGNKTITADADIISQLRMLNGVLVTGTKTLTLLEQATVTETNDSYVLGRLRASRTLLAGLQQAFGGLGLELTPLVGSLLPGTVEVVRVTGAPASNAGNQGIKRYFDVTAALNVGLNIGMKFYYLPHELNGIPTANLRFFKSVDGGANWQPRGISGAGSGFAVLNNVDGFSRWTLGDVARPLPVGLTAFRAARQGQHALLTWTTASEVNNRGFGVEVSTDGHAFRSLGFVTAQQGGSPTATRTYEFADREAGKQGVRYYRLRQEDLDGKTTYYGPATVSFEGQLTPQLAAYPTAFSSELTVELTSPTAAPVAFALTDALGRVVWRSTQPATSGFNTTHLAPACPAGAYLLTATVGGQVLHQRVVKQ